MTFITGKQFNEQFHNTSVVKLTSRNDCQYNIGLNILDEKPICSNGEMFCYFKKDFIGRLDKTVVHMWDVIIPNNAKVVILSEKIKVDRLILSNKRDIYSKEGYMEMVKQRKDVLRYIPCDMITNELCEITVTYNIMNLSFIPSHMITKELRNNAIKNSGTILEFNPSCINADCLHKFDKKYIMLDIKMTKTDFDQVFDGFSGRRGYNKAVVIIDALGYYGCDFTMKEVSAYMIKSLNVNDLDVSLEICDLIKEILEYDMTVYDSLW